MKSKWLFTCMLISVVVLTLMLVYFVNPFSNNNPNPPSLADLGQFNLNIASVDVVDEITMHDVSLLGIKNPSISVKEGYKLVVVTLKGMTSAYNQKRQITLSFDDFTAIYQEEATNIEEDEKEFQSFSLARSLACRPQFDSMDLGIWIMPSDEKSPSSLTMRVPAESTSVTLKVAFGLPNKVSSFYVRYPEFATGKASLTEEADKK